MQQWTKLYTKQNDLRFHQVSHTCSVSFEMIFNFFFASYHFSSIARKAEKDLIIKENEIHQCTALCNVIVVRHKIIVLKRTFFCKTE